MLKMSLSDQENSSQPIKRRKKINMKPFALSQPVVMLEAMDIDNIVAKPAKRTSSIAAETTVVKKAKSQNNNRSMVSNDGDSARFVNSSAGVVKTIKLTNFMCHSNFEIKFNPRINFISGCNGSGKSAIQTAMVVGLGGVASKTNRSSRIDGLIKHGCNSGTVVINLSNTGWNAYKPEDYGNSIQITRHITQSSSSYKIHNQWGKLMSSSKKELDSILTRFRIQPNNPVSILNQDMARNFLSSNKAEGKYALFKKAMLLDEAEDLLHKVACEIEEQETSMESKKKAIKLIEEEITGMSKKIKLVEQLKESKRKKYTLSNEYVWSKVANSRNKINNLTKTRNEEEDKRNNLQAQMNELKAQEEEFMNQKKKYENDIASIQEECKNREKTRERLVSEFRKQKQEYESICMKCEELESKLKTRNKDNIELKRGLDDIQKMDLEQKQKKQEAALQKSKLKDGLDLYESKMNVLNGEITRLKNTAEHFAEKITRKRKSIQDMRDQIAICERQIQNTGNNSDNLSMYDSWMPTLVQKINEAVKNRKFSKPPRGPLGRYIKVKNEKWIYAIESNLSVGLLNSFLVNNGNDRRVLYAIMDQVIGSGHKPTVHTSSFQERKRDDMLPQLETTYPGYSNMLRALTISDLVVTNFLMDFRNIQRILLVEKDEECRNFVSRDENIPVKCQLILNLEADQFLPGFRVYANQDSNRRSRILRKSAADHMRGLKEEIAEKHESINEATREMDGDRQQWVQCTERIKEISLNIDSLKGKIIESRIKIKDLSSVIEMEVPTLQMKLDEIKEIEAEMKHFENEKQALIEKRKEAEYRMMEAKTQMNAGNQEDFFTQQTQLNVDREKVSRQMSFLKARLATLMKAFEEQNQKVIALDTRIKNTGNVLVDEENSARELSEEEVNTQRTPLDIQQEMKEIELFIVEAEKKLGTEVLNFERQYINKRQTLGDTLKTFRELTKLHKRMKRMHAQRKDLVGKLRDVNASVIMAQFQTVLHSRNYRGTLKFDHARGKLDIMMAPIDGGDTLMNTSSLSGGEKSYSTVAFLLALWSNMELPFYSMDEYDVFMDAINRKTITKLLMSFAEKKDGRQFIFLTPLDISIIQPGVNVQVHRINKIQN